LKYNITEHFLMRILLFDDQKTDVLKLNTSAPGFFAKAKMDPSDFSSEK